MTIQQEVKKRCNELEYPMLEEYDFRNDTVNANLDIDLKPATVIRPYQETSLSKMFGNGSATFCPSSPRVSANPHVAVRGQASLYSLVVLERPSSESPQHVQSRSLVWFSARHCEPQSWFLLTPIANISPVCQWCSGNNNLCSGQMSPIVKSQCLRQTRRRKYVHIAFPLFVTLKDSKFAGESGIVVSTYSMVANTHNRSHESKKMMEFLTSREWGFILLDEVHVVPAAMFRRVVTTIKAHSKLGLTG